MELLEYFKIFADVAKSLFSQWNLVEDVANNLIDFVEKFSLELLKKFWLAPKNTEGLNIWKGLIPDMLDYVKLFADVAKELFKQWDSIESVASNFIKMLESVSLAILGKID